MENLAHPTYRVYRPPNKLIRSLTFAHFRQVNITSLHVLSLYKSATYTYSSMYYFAYTELYVADLYNDNTCKLVMFTCEKCTKFLDLIGLSGGVILDSSTCNLAI